MYIFNRFLNSLINKLSWIALILFIGLICFFTGLWITDAAEINYSSSSYKVLYSSVLNGTNSNTDYINLGTSYSFDVNSYMTSLLLQTYSNNNNYFKKGNNYTFTYLINFNPKGDFSLYHFDNTEVLWYGNTPSNNGLSQSYIQNGTIKIENITEGSYANYQIRFIFSFEPNTDLSHILFRLNFPIQSSTSPIFSCGSVNGACPYALNGINPISLVITEETGTVGAIQNQTNIIINNQNENTDKVIDSITNDNTDKSEETGKNFFDNFEIKDNGSVSSIVTAPLRLIQSLVQNSNSCTNLDFNIKILDKDNDVSIPSGCSFWNKVPQSVISLYHMLVYGLITYRLGISLFKVIEDFKDPTDSEVKTLDL